MGMFLYNCFTIYYKNITIQVEGNAQHHPYCKKNGFRTEVVFLF